MSNSGKKKKSHESPQSSRIRTGVRTHITRASDRSMALTAKRWDELWSQNLHHQGRTAAGENFSEPSASVPLIRQEQHATVISLTPGLGCSWVAAWLLDTVGSLGMEGTPCASQTSAEKGLHSLWHFVPEDASENIFPHSHRGAVHAAADQSCAH